MRYRVPRYLCNRDLVCMAEYTTPEQQRAGSDGGASPRDDVTSRKARKDRISEINALLTRARGQLIAVYGGVFASRDVTFETLMRKKLNTIDTDISELSKKSDHAEFYKKYNEIETALKNAITTIRNPDMHTSWTLKEQNRKIERERKKHRERQIEKLRREMEARNIAARIRAERARREKELERARKAQNERKRSSVESNRRTETLLF